MILATLLQVSSALAPTGGADGAALPLIWTDYDGDGYRDAVVVEPGAPLRLLHNEADGTLADVTAVAGLGGIPAPSFAAWGDYDADGVLDLAVGIRGGGTQLFRGTGSGFESATETAGLVHRGEALGGEWLDYDGDGRMDLYLRTSAASLLFWNAGNGAFEPVALGPDSMGGMGEVPLVRASGALEEAAATGGTAGAPPERPVPSGSGSGEPRGGGRVAVRGPGAATTTTPGALPLRVNPLTCVESLEDQGGSGCLMASSTPTLGQLYPLSQELYVDPGTGFVGLGTTSPTGRLSVEGDAELNGDLTFADDAASIHFPRPKGSDVPMFFMYDAGNAGQLVRTIIAESPTDPGDGLRYVPGMRVFAFCREGKIFEEEVMGVDIDTGNVGIGTIDPQARLHVVDSFSADLHLESPWYATIVLEADTDNSFEGDHPSILFSQDGGLVQARVGFRDMDNDFSVRNHYSDGGLRFDIHTSSLRNWEFRRRASVAIDVEARITQPGNLQLDGNVSSPAADLAEVYDVLGTVEPGDVVAFSGAALARAQLGDGSRLAGVISSRPAFLMGLSYTDEDEAGVPPPSRADPFDGDRSELRVDRDVLHEIEVNGRAPLALAGRVPVKVTAENGPIQPGDLLSLSSVPGRAAKAAGSGVVVGTALQSWAAGEGKILAFVRQGWYAQGTEAQSVADLSREVTALRSQVQALVEVLGLPAAGD